MSFALLPWPWALPMNHSAGHSPHTPDRRSRYRTRHVALQNQIPGSATVQLAEWVFESLPIYRVVNFVLTIKNSRELTFSKLELDSSGKD